MSNDEIIERTVAFVKAQLAHAEGGHDWWHIHRVWHIAREIQSKETADALTVELAALLHDIADSKFHGGDESVGPRRAEEFLQTIGIDEHTTTHVVNIIKHISFKNSHFEQSFTSPELMVVQDADRLDAIGAIGIARAFSYGGYKNRPFYDPDILPNMNMTKEEYKNSTAPTVNHFYEKLLLLKDKMNTQTGRALAEKRHEFMVEYLEQFYREWEGKY
jgi:uncharacterized protein